MAVHRRPCSSGDPTCSEIPSTFAWGRKAPSIHSVPRGGRTRVLFGERLCTRTRRSTHFTILFAQARYPVVETESKDCGNLTLDTILTLDMIETGNT